MGALSQSGGPSLQDRRAIRLNEAANLAIARALAPVLDGHSLAG